MTDAELIARQAKRIAELEDEVAGYESAVKSALGVMFCIGGPLNDNKLHYTREQMRDFFRIKEFLE